MSGARPLTAPEVFPVGSLVLLRRDLNGTHVLRGVVTGHRAGNVLVTWTNSLDATDGLAGGFLDFENAADCMFVRQNQPRHRWAIQCRHLDGRRCGYQFDESGN